MILPGTIERDRTRRDDRTADGAPAACRPGAAGAIHRPFFLAAIAVVLTVGAGWGVLLLWKISRGGSFTGVSVHEVNAHGHAQIMGWVGLFIMGFACQALPRIWRVELPWPRLALASLAGVLAAIALRGAGMMGSGAGWALPAHEAGVVIQLLAVGLFAATVATAFVRSGQSVTPSAAFILTATGFMLLQSIVSGWHVARLMTAPTRDAMLHQIATWQAPLRDLQIHGMAMLMILGIGLSRFPELFGFGEVPRRRAWWAYGLLVTAIAGETALFVSYRLTESRAYAGAMIVPWLLLPIGAWLLVGAWKPWRRTGGERGMVAARAAGTITTAVPPDRSLKFIRVAFVWLFIAFAMLAAMPGYLAVYDGAFSHAYYGAIRHAITVGFISMTIMGMGAKVVARLDGGDVTTLPSLWASFLLVNTGCALRVVLQVATDWTPAAFPLIGVSGVLELAGLGLWGAHLARIMVHGRGWSVLRPDRPLLPSA